MTVNLASLEFVADAVVAHLRSGGRPTRSEGVDLTCLPFITALRARIVPDDLPWLFDAINQVGDDAYLYISLLLQFTSQPAVQDLLRKNWEGASPSLKAFSFWQIHEDPALNDVWRKNLFDFAMDEWGTFSKVVLTFFGTPEEVLLYVERRIADPLVPKRKKWAYLCCLPQIAANQDAVKEIITKSQSDPDPFVREVAGKLLKRFF